MYRLSIITVNLNDAAGLIRTIESVLLQTYAPIEFIIVDGGSKDGSLEIIEKYGRRIQYWVSQPDKGIYNAMNKGIRVATGEYCLFLNSGDWLTHNDVLTDVFATNPTADIVAGDIYFYNTLQKQIHWKVTSPESLTARTLFSGTLSHQSAFIKRSLFDSIGYYNENMKIVSDWMFFLEALLEKGCSYHHFKGVISYFDMDGISCNATNNELLSRERLAVLEKKYPRFLADYDRLEHLDNQSSQWLASHEYSVYKVFELVGLIKLGVVIRRGIRFLKRKIYHKL